VLGWRTKIESSVQIVRKRTPTPLTPLLFQVQLIRNYNNRKERKSKLLLNSITH